jgi:hypothetical protein
LKCAYYSVEVYRFFKKSIAEKLVSVQTVNAKCGIKNQKVGKYSNAIEAKM